ncbi:MAG: AraC family transcriptional regulator [Clostridia bacterium]|nr:AraC family transcriptional regulator [Clostridia bacterium]
MWLSNRGCLPIAETDRSLYFLNVNHIKVESGWYYPLHAHEWFELVYCVKGCGSVTFQATTFLLKEGMALIIPPNTFHSFFAKDTENFEYCVLGLFADPASEVASRLASPPSVLCDITGRIPAICAAYDTIYETYENGRYREHPLFFATCLQLMYTMLYALEYAPIEQPILMNTLTNRILSYIHAHYPEEISLESLSKAFAISIPHLSRLFKQAYNTSPINYLIDYRFTVAKDYLSQSDIDIQEIARMVGYGNASHFCKLFEKRTGYSPSAYRELKLKTQPRSDLPLNLIENVAVKQWARSGNRPPLG